jgi:hypothetical protein
VAVGVGVLVAAGVLVADGVAVGVPLGAVADVLDRGEFPKPPMNNGSTEP